MPDTLSIVDNRTGKKYDLPIQDGTIRAMDLRQVTQPILVGHHSEKRHRAALDKVDTNMRKGIEAERGRCPAHRPARRTRRRCSRHSG